MYRDDDHIVTAQGCFPVQCVVSGVPDGSLPALTTALGLKAAPNPFNPRTVVSFVMPAAGDARLALHDLAGRRVRTLLDARVAAGPQELPWDGRDETGRLVASGLYFAHLQAGALRETTKLVLVR